MTNEEAIKTLKGESWICCQEKWKEALNMAIKALEQESILDKIRAEIEQVAEEESKIDKKWAQGLKYALIIIDKYKAESEDAE